MPDEIFDAAERALKDGDLSALAALAGPLEAATRGCGTDPATLRRLRARSARLSRRLEAVMEGLQAARWRLQDIRAMGEGGRQLVTYDGAGRRTEQDGSARLTRRF
ncbi:hypothetical protein [Falsirhodobacter algicola]|uniref:Flagellar protein FlgN n=1 Tax=Falsirhodobacter algicola TaxID=2692330 RepID=A0A8J8MSK7_9RHOB|nr:hypothetical protein [Falsirhodobacter algicola]QUS35941.1 hypothetical protein GR316_06505 [Falsirhodobacter algicola]